MPSAKTSTVATRDTATQLRIGIGAFKRRAQEAMDEGELTESQLRVLARLERHGTATTAELARREQMTPQAMGTIVSSLEQLGFITRTADASDGRRIILGVAEAGRQAVYSGRSAIVDKISAALTESFTSEEIEALRTAAPLIQRLSDLM